MRPISSFILKVASRCNIACDYCYMYELADQSWRRRPVFMSEEVLERVAERIGSHAQTHALRSVRIILHGGEPLLLGPERLDRFCERLRASVPPSVRVALALQTNGTLLTHDFLPVLRAHRVSVAFSLDGPSDVNDLHRLDRQGQSTHHRTVTGISLLREELIDAYSGVLSVVDLRADPTATYKYLADLQPPLLDFNLPHATYATPPARHGPAPAYGRWLAEVFDAWAAGDQYHSIRFFDHVIALSMGASNSVEYLGLAEVDLIVVEADGAIEGVDALKASFDGAPDLGLNVFEHDFDDALAAPQIARRQTGVDELASTCRSCDLVTICGGGYLPHRWSPSVGFDNPSVYCEDLAFVIRHIRDRAGLA